MTKKKAIEKIGDYILKIKEPRFIPGVGIVTPDDVEKAKSKKVKEVKEK